MSSALGRTTRWVAVAAVAGYPVLAHYGAAGTAAAASPGLGAAVALAPPLAMLLWLAWDSSRRRAWLLACAVVGVAVWAFWGTLGQHVAWVYFIQHAGTNVLLAALFGRTLAGGGQPLCTRLAEAVRGSLSPEVIRYTRQITAAWTLFFVAVALVSTGLFLWADIGTWSIFANLLWFPLILLMFAAEYLVRLQRLPHLEHHGVRAAMRAFYKVPKLSPGARPPAP